MAKQQIKVTLMYEDAAGRVATRVLGMVEGVRAALSFARNQAGEGATFFSRGERQYRQRGYIGANGTVIVD